MKWALATAVAAGASAASLFVDLHRLGDLLAILGSCWFFARSCGLAIWKLVAAVQAVVKEFQGMRSDLKALGDRVTALESRKAVLHV